MGVWPDLRPHEAAAHGAKTATRFVQVFLLTAVTLAISSCVSSGPESVQTRSSPGSSGSTSAQKPVFPNTGSTGVPAGIELEPSGDVTVTQDGTVIDGLHVNGRITVNADDVTIRNTLVQTDTSLYPIRVNNESIGVLIENVEVDNQGGTGIGIFLQGTATVRSTDIHSAEDGIRIQADDVLIEDSYIHDLQRFEGSHHDSIQIRSGDDVTIRGNNLQAYVASEDDPMNAAIQIGSLSGDDPINNLLVVGNLMNGGNHTINGGGRGEVESARYSGNEFGRDFRYSPAANIENSVWAVTNVWRDTGEPVQ